MPRKLRAQGGTDVLQTIDDALIADADRLDADDIVSIQEQQPKRRCSGRVRHDEKITVYVSREELVMLEQARLQLRTDHNLAIDRGRLVRESITLCLEGLARDGAESELVHRLAGS